MEEIDNSKIKYLLYKIMLLLRKNRLTRNIYLLLDDLGIRITLSKIFNYVNNKRLNKKVSYEMQQSRDYFRKHYDDINKILSILNDVKSKKTYEQMISFRQSFDNRTLPYNSYNKQYWFSDYFNYNNSEIMIDCGAFDGDSVRSFVKAMEGKHIKDYKIIAFEPDDENYKTLSRNYPDVISMKIGVGENHGSKPFEMRNNLTSCIVNLQEKDFNNNIKYIDIKRIDDVKECQDATIIKMDIEGGEYEALLGAEKIIKRNKPKLAISIYHKDEDFIRIPLLIHEWVPEYKLYVMQHSNTICDTVLYATL